MIERLAGLEGARGVAALMVFVFHVWFFALAVPGRPTGLPIADAILGHLWVGLTFFFVLSGFLLYRPFAAAALAGSPPPRVARYAVARAIRILPAYWFALLFAPALLGLHVTGWQLLANLAFLQTYISDGVVVIGPSWTLCIEASFYLVLPLVALAGARAARQSPRRLLTALSPLVALGISCRAGLTLHGVEKLPETIDLFAVGMMTAVIVEAGWGRRWMPLLAVPAVAIAAPLHHDGPGVVAGDPTWAALFDTFIAAGFGCMVIGIVMNVRPLRFFSWRPVVALGTVSYGLYLWHQTLLLYLVWNLRSTRDIAVLPRAVIALGASLLIATVSWFAVERPLQRFARGRREGSSTAPAAAAST